MAVAQNMYVSLDKPYNVFKLYWYYHHHLALTPLGSIEGIHKQQPTNSVHYHEIRISHLSTPCAKLFLCNNNSSSRTLRPTSLTIELRLLYGIAVPDQRLKNDIVSWFAQCKDNPIQISSTFIILLVICFLFPNLLSVYKHHQLRSWS